MVQLMSAPKMLCETRKIQYHAEGMDPSSYWLCLCRDLKCMGSCANLGFHQGFCMHCTLVLLKMYSKLKVNCVVDFQFCCWCCTASALSIHILQVV